MKMKLLSVLLAGLFILSTLQGATPIFLPTSTAVEDVVVTESDEVIVTESSSYILGDTHMSPMSTIDVRIRNDRRMALGPSGISAEQMTPLAEQALANAQFKHVATPAYNLSDVVAFYYYEGWLGVPEAYGFVSYMWFKLMAIGEHCYVWVNEKEAWSATNKAPHEAYGQTGFVNDTKAQEIATLYDDSVYPAAEIFGDPYDVDADPKINILMYDITPGQNYDSAYFTMGYYLWFNDLPAEDGNPYWDSFSNQMECFYLDTYPTIYEAWYDTDGDGYEDSYFTPWVDTTVSRRNLVRQTHQLTTWDVTLENQTNAAGLIEPVVGGWFSGTADLTNTYWEVSVTTDGLIYYDVTEADVTNYTLNTAEGQIGLTGYFGEGGNFYIHVVDTTWGSTVGTEGYLVGTVVGVTDYGGAPDSPVVTGTYNGLIDNGILYVKVTSDGWITPHFDVSTNCTSTVGITYDLAQEYYLEVYSGGHYATTITADNATNTLLDPAVSGTYIYGADSDFYVQINKTGHTIASASEYVTSSNPIISQVFNPSLAVWDWEPLNATADADFYPAVTGTFTGTTDTTYYVKVSTGGMLGVDYGVSVVFSTDNTTWSAPTLLQANYPAKILDGTGVWGGLNIDFSNFFYNLVTNDIFVLSAGADDNPTVIFSTDGVTYGSSITLSSETPVSIVDEDGNQTGLKLDFAGITEVTVGDTWLIQVVNNDRPVIFFYNAALTYLGNATYVADGVTIPFYNTTSSAVQGSSGIVAVLDIANGFLTEGEVFKVEVIPSDAAELRFSSDNVTYGAAVTYTGGAVTITEELGNATGLSANFDGVFDYLATGYYWTIEVAAATEIGLEFSDDLATWYSLTIDATNQTIPLYDHLGAEVDTVELDLSDFDKFVVGDWYNLTFIHDTNVIATVNGTDYTLNSTNSALPLGESGVNLDFYNTELTTGMAWNLTLNVYAYDVSPVCMYWGVDYITHPLAAMNRELIENNNNYNEEEYIGLGLDLFATYWHSAGKTQYSRFISRTT